MGSLFNIETFFFNDSATTDVYRDGHSLSLHDSLPICLRDRLAHGFGTMTGQGWPVLDGLSRPISLHARKMQQHGEARGPFNERADRGTAKAEEDRKSTRLNSSH